MNHSSAGTDSLDLLLELVSQVVAVEGASTTTVHVIVDVVVTVLVDEFHMHSESFQVSFPLVGEFMAVEVHFSRSEHAIFHVKVMMNDRRCGREMTVSTVSAVTTMSVSGMTVAAMTTVTVTGMTVATMTTVSGSGMTVAGVTTMSTVLMDRVVNHSAQKLLGERFALVTGFGLLGSLHCGQAQNDGCCDDEILHCRIPLISSVRATIRDFRVRRFAGLLLCFQ